LHFQDANPSWDTLFEHYNSQGMVLFPDESGEAGKFIALNAAQYKAFGSHLEKIGHWDRAETHDTDDDDDEDDDRASPKDAKALRRAEDEALKHAAEKVKYQKRNLQCYEGFYMNKPDDAAEVGGELRKFLGKRKEQPVRVDHHDFFVKRATLAYEAAGFEVEFHSTTKTAYRDARKGEAPGVYGLHRAVHRSHDEKHESFRNGKVALEATIDVFVARKRSA
jgi:hypothetical protein